MFGGSGDVVITQPSTIKKEVSVTFALPLSHTHTDTKLLQRNLINQSADKADKFDLDDIEASRHTS